MMLQGSIPALITPMFADGSIDWDSLSNLIEWHIKSKSDAISVTGTTGESPTLSTEEHIKVIEFAVDKARGRIPIVAGSGANCTREAIELTQATKNAKADFSLSVTPYYNKPSQTGLYQHFVAIATSVDIPIILYDVPGRTGIELTVDTVVKLAKIPNIVGIKDATGNLEKIKQLKEKCPENFALLSGDDGTFVDFMALGGHGTISVTANLAPNEMHNICKLMNNRNDNDATMAHKINANLVALHKNLFVESNPIAVKYALQRLQKSQAGIRLPLTWAEKSTQTLIDEALTACKLLPL